MTAKWAYQVYILTGVRSQTIVQLAIYIPEHNPDLPTHYNDLAYTARILLQPRDHFDVTSHGTNTIACAYTVAYSVTTSTDNRLSA